MKPVSVIVIAVVACACGPAARPYRPALELDGHGWWCTAGSGGVTTCERSEHACNRAGQALQRQIGPAAYFSDCAPQPTVYCFSEDPPPGGFPRFTDDCHVDKRSCERARSWLMRTTYLPGLQLTECGAAD